MNQEHQPRYYSRRPRHYSRRIFVVASIIDEDKAWSAEHAAAEPTLLKAEARRGFGLEPAVTTEIIAEQHELAHLFLGLGLIPEPIEVAQAPLDLAARAS